MVFFMQAVKARRAVRRERIFRDRENPLIARAFTAVMISLYIACFLWFVTALLNFDKSISFLESNNSIRQRISLSEKLGFLLTVCLPSAIIGNRSGENANFEFSMLCRNSLCTCTSVVTKSHNDKLVQPPLTSSVRRAYVRTNFVRRSVNDRPNAWSYVQL